MLQAHCEVSNEQVFTLLKCFFIEMFLYWNVSLLKCFFTEMFLLPKNVLLRKKYFKTKFYNSNSIVTLYIVKHICVYIKTNI